MYHFLHKPKYLTYIFPVSDFDVQYVIRKLIKFRMLIPKLKNLMVPKGDLNWMLNIANLGLSELLRLY